MKKSFLALVLTLGVGTLFTASNSYAIPALQLDIKDGVYDSTTETTIATTSVFDLYALLTPNNKVSFSEAAKYYISVAVLPALDTATNLGSFKINGNVIDVTSGMVYGVPPLESVMVLQGFDANDLSQHSIFPTYFAEFEFDFDAGSFVPAYDVETDTLKGNGDISYRKTFTIDVSNLTSGYVLHFDLYDTVVKSSKDGEDVDVNNFAPFSHDAQSDPGTPVPEPTTMLLFGAGLAGLAAVGRRRKDA